MSEAHMPTERWGKSEPVTVTEQERKKKKNEACAGIGGRYKNAASAIISV